MKMLVLAFLSFSALASEPILITSEKLNLDESILNGPVTLVRNINSPSTVELTMPTHPVSVCVKHEIKQVFGPSSQCGTYTVPVCQLEEYDCVDRVRCTMPSEIWGCQNEEWYKVCQYRQVCHEEERNLSCNHDAKVCVEEKLVNNGPSKETIKFVLSKRQMKKEHQLILQLMKGNWLKLSSPKLQQAYDYNQRVWTLSK